MSSDVHVGGGYSSPSAGVWQFYALWDWPCHCLASGKQRRL